jgi:hypothetical protein
MYGIDFLIVLNELAAFGPPHRGGVSARDFHLTG